MNTLLIAWLLAGLPAQTQDLPSAAEQLKQRSEELATGAREKVEEIAADVDKSKTAHEASAGILKPIDTLAEYMSFPEFHWLAFTLMTAGVVSFALQLVLAKLVVLSKLGFSLKEILSDTLGFLISLIGLILTTQAATENSNFTESPAAVLSATAVGFVVGITFYRWGQAQEVKATEARRD